LVLHNSRSQSNSMFIELDSNKIPPVVKGRFGNGLQMSVKDEVVLYPERKRMNQV
jgi:hypothetical protein